MLSLVKVLRKMHDRLYWICAQNTSSFLIDVQQSFSPLTAVVFTLFLPSFKGKIAWNYYWNY